MAIDPADEAYLDAAAALLDLPIRQEHRDEVLIAFAALRAQARLLDAFDLPAAVEAAPRFMP